MNQPKIILIAGPNGAGKTTFAREFLPFEADCPSFLNADLIAAGLAPFAPDTAAIQAGRLMLGAVASHVQHRESFALETTLSGLSYARQIPRWRASGFRVELLFLALPSADSAVLRVARRVRQGGHSIPEATIRRRFEAGMRNFQGVYRQLVDAWMLYDSSRSRPELIEFGGSPQIDRGVREPVPEYDDRGEPIFPPGVHPDLPGSWRAMLRAAQRARDIAAQTGTDLVIVRDGQVIAVNPRDLPPLESP